MTIVFPVFSNPFEAMWWIFLHGGWVVFAISFVFGILWVYLDIIQTRYMMRMQHVLLAVDVPRENEQTPKAVEHMFAHIHGIHKGPDWKEKYLDGYVQASVSVELISVGGFIQFLIRTPVLHRDLIEASIYAQYPNAEIAEVEDYVNDAPSRYPNDEYDMWGAEIVPYNNDVYPIRTYPLWEHPLTQTFLDPMASTLEILGRIQQGEQIWLQLVLRPPATDSWRTRALDEINKLVGMKVAKKTSALDSIAGVPTNFAMGAFQTVTRTLFEPGETMQKKEKDAPPSLMQHIPPNVRVVVEGVGMKASKVAFDVKFRFIYIAKKELFDKSRVSAIFGALKQYAAMDMNGFKPDSKMKTKRVWFFVKQRENNIKRRLYLGYKYRSIWRGRKTFILNIEELASLWHFPVITVKAPLVKKTEAKRGEPPMALPIGEEIEYQPKTQPAAPNIASAGPPPTDVPTS